MLLFANSGGTEVDGTGSRRVRLLPRASGCHHIIMEVRQMRFERCIDDTIVSKFEINTLHM
jgi:hypothetical protein